MLNCNHKKQYSLKNQSFKVLEFWKKMWRNLNFFYFFVAHPFKVVITAQPLGAHKHLLPQNPGKNITWIKTCPSVLTEAEKCSSIILFTGLTLYFSRQIYIAHLLHFFFDVQKVTCFILIPKHKCISNMYVVYTVNSRDTIWRSISCISSMFILTKKIYILFLSFLLKMICWQNILLIVYNFIRV